jgi:cob(I)alamin adenosyltransferase
MKIYTKTGDDGSTALYGGRRVFKNDAQVEGYGTVDELNSWIGLLKDLHPNLEVKAQLLQIQENLFTIGAHLASDPNKPLKLPLIRPEDCHFLEQAIDHMDQQLPALKHFILPGGHVLVSNVHITRTVCRRAERLVVALNQSLVLPPELIIFLNRLSDYLFVLARYTAWELKVEEMPWKPGH